MIRTPCTWEIRFTTMRRHLLCASKSPDHKTCNAISCADAGEHFPRKVALVILPVDIEMTQDFSYDILYIIIKTCDKGNRATIFYEHNITHWIEAKQIIPNWKELRLGSDERSSSTLCMSFIHPFIDSEYISNIYFTEYCRHIHGNCNVGSTTIL